VSTNAKVEIYSSPTCSDCKAGKEFLTEHHIDFIEHDVSQLSEADALKKLTGKSIVPTFLIGDKSYMDLRQVEGH